MTAGASTELSFVETTAFTRRVQRLALEDDLRALQLDLVANPESGRLDPGTGGLRKVRMGSSARGKGKRSGARVHFLYLPHRRRIYLIFVYGKDERDTLTPEQKTQLRRVVQAIERE